MVVWGFRGRWFRNRCQVFEIQNCGSNMADRNFEKFPIIMKIHIWGFSKMLITNPWSDFENLKWRFQYGGLSFLIVQFSWGFVHTGFLGRWFRIRCQIFEIQNGGSNMAERNFEKFPVFLEIFIYRDFPGCWRQICRQIFKLKNGSSNMAADNFENCFISKFKMAEWNFDKVPIFMKIYIWGFSEMLITNLRSDFENSKWRFHLTLDL